ncbi:DUF1127 domain-containing protein [uncultured Pelagimonas sp.]|uniref:DUF1127 domain-containing protein n=1 Tax=uncultured Pelagimonas sp. TaxID=1618102 RepID=UPI00262FC3FB|nr:DUF1127 domain-containing protein [uncultured Pelagimonas sp.]
MAHIANTAPATFAPVAWFNNMVAVTQDYLARRATYTRVFNELSALNDRELDDMGLSRADFHAIAAESAAKV